jgi:hypothetical protein
MQAKAKQEADKKAKQEAEQKAKQEAEKKAKQEAEVRGRPTFILVSPLLPACPVYMSSKCTVCSHNSSALTQQQLRTGVGCHSLSFLRGHVSYRGRSAITHTCNEKQLMFMSMLHDVEPHGAHASTFPRP